MADIDIDQDDDYANDVRSLRREASMIKIEQIDHYADDERSIRRLRRNSAKVTYSPSSCSQNGKKREVDDNYALFLNFYESQGKCSSFESKDEVDSDFDLQYYKFLSFLKPVKASYALDLVRGDGTSELFTYEDVNETSDPLVHNANPNAAGQEENGVLDIGKRKRFKSTDKPSVTLRRSVTEDKMGEENARHPYLEESFIVGSEYTSLKSVGTDSQMRSVDASYQFYLHRNFSLKPSSGKYANTVPDAMDIQDAYVDPKSRLTNCLRQNMGRKNEGKRSHCRKLGNSRQKEFLDKSAQKDAGIRVSNNKQSKRRKLAEDNDESGRRSVAPKVDQEGSDAAVPLRVIPDDKLGGKNWLSRNLKLATKRKLVDRVAEDTAGLHALHAVQSPGKKPLPKNHQKSRPELKFDRPINVSYKTFLSGLGYKEGHLVFQSEEGNVVAYEKVLKESSTDSESDSDSVIITGERVNGRYRKYYSFVASKSSPQVLISLIFNFSI